MELVHMFSFKDGMPQVPSRQVKGSLRAPESGSLRAPWVFLEHQKSGSLRAPETHTFRETLGDTGLGHGVGLGDKWGHGAGTWAGFRGPAWWNETFRISFRVTWGHGAGTWGGFRGQVGTWSWDMGSL